MLVQSCRTRDVVDAGKPAVDMVGKSSAMKHLREAIRKVASSSRTVLIQGPTGSGKELVARAIHALGPHPRAPLVEVNCGGFPETLIEGQLFGWERGSFTGAERRHDGFFMTTADGTLFLDELGELPLSLQAKLLRVLETRRFRPLGGTRDLDFDGRVVAATHVDLDEGTRIGTFREDLYYRIGVLVIRVPSLDERREDIPDLVAHFASMVDRPIRFAADAVEALTRRPWPGNVRQLRNAVDRLAVFAETDVITRDVVEQVCVPTTSRPAAPTSLRALARCALQLDSLDKLDAMERALIDEALAASGGNRSLAARILGVDRKVIERRLASRRRDVPSEGE